MCIKVNICRKLFIYELKLQYIYKGRLKYFSEANKHRISQFTAEIVFIKTTQYFKIDKNNNITLYVLIFQ